MQASQTLKIKKSMGEKVSRDSTRGAGSGICRDGMRRRRNRQSALFAGGQAKELFELARKNAGDLQPMTGLGEEAFWDGVIESLHVVKGKYHLTIQVGNEDGGLEAARQLTVKLLGRLP